jgi:putative phage-type endonuclease
MTVEIIQITSEAQWLGERKKDITSTEIPALYGLSPYKTEFELFHEKRDGVSVKFEANERMKWGNRLEAAIAHGAAEEMGWSIAPLKVYMRDPDLRMGSSFDFEILDSAKGKGILEVKNVDGLQYARNWLDDGNGNIEAPEHIELQIQHQMELTGYEWTALCLLVGGNTLKIVLRSRDKEIGADIRKKIAEFWAKVDANAAPNPDYSADAEFIIKQLRGDSIDGLVAQSDAALDALIERYDYLGKSIKEQTEIREATKAEILMAIGSASKVISQLGTISCGTTKDSLGTQITADMVGTYYGARKGFRNFRFTAKKEK